jgi:hypothetical protein
MIINKDSKCINVLKMGTLCIITSLNLIHGLATSKYILDCIIHWVVKETGNIVLIWSNICWITIKALTHLKYTGRCTILSPKALRNLWNSVDTNSIKAIGCD